MTIPSSDRNVLDVSTVTLLLQSMSNLRSLTIDSIPSMMDGHQWEELIRNNLPKLKKLRFRMEETFRSSETLLERMRKLIESFRGAFWTVEHRWFVRCIVLEKMIYLYTKPYIFPQAIPTSKFFISTDLSDDLQKFCDDINIISGTNLLDEHRSSNRHFTNIESLMLSFPIDNQIWSMIPTLNKLHSLTLYGNWNIACSQLQTLFDGAPHLDQLTIHVDRILASEILSLKHINTSIRQLNIEFDEFSVDEETCRAFVRLPLAACCDVLSINVWNNESVLTLISNMRRLRLLKVVNHAMAHFNHWREKYPPLRAEEMETSLTNEILQWLTERLPSTYMIAKSPEYSLEIRIWT